MSRIFISHNSADNQITEDIRNRLESAGHHFVYVDFDPNQGIAAGQDWEHDLYRELRACQALIILCSNASMKSQWCFAEVIHAKSMGKTVIPVKIEDCEIHSILTRNQWIDWTSDREDAWARLQRGLLKAGIDPRNSFNWDDTRSPYPGLLAFQPEDAAIYFGREDEIQAGMDILKQQQRFGGSRSMMVLGPSGSGKSSLVRAGILPRLKQNEQDWIVLDVIRPRSDPARELHWTLTHALEEAAESSKAANTELSVNLANPEHLCECLEDLRRASGRRDATVLLVIDQAEELLSKEDSAAGRMQSFIELIVGSLELENCALQVIWTIRTDFLAAFQQHPQLGQLKSDDLQVGLMDSADLFAVIERPAEMAGVVLEDGLSQKIVSEVQDTDALPLLAFTLRELYEQYHDDGKLEIREYEQLGGLAGSIARTAEQAFRSSNLSPEQETALKRVFLSMARIEEGGGFARRIISRDSVPVSVSKVIDRFIEARLLVASANNEVHTIEVAHEALFRAWKRMAGWLLEGQEFLRWRRRLDFDTAEWLRSDKNEDLLLRGRKLIEADDYMANHPDMGLEPQPDAFVMASCDLRHREKVKKRWILGIVLVSVVGLALLIQGWRQQTETERQLSAEKQKSSDAALAEQEEAAGRSRYNSNLLEVSNRGSDGFEWRNSRTRFKYEPLEDIASFPPKYRDLTWAFLHANFGEDYGPDELDFSPVGDGSQPSAPLSPDRTRIAYIDGGDLILGLTARPGDDEFVEEIGLDETWAKPDTINYAPGGLVVLSKNGVIRFWDDSTLTRRPDLATGARKVVRLKFAPDAQFMAALLELADGSSSIVVFKLPEGTQVYRLAEIKQDRYAEPRFDLSADNRWFAASLGDQLQVVDLLSGELTLELPAALMGGLAFSNRADDVRLAWQTYGDELHIARIPGGEVEHRLPGHTASIISMVWSPDDSKLVAADDADETIIWDLSNDKPIASLPVSFARQKASFAFSDDGNTLLTFGEKLNFWDAKTGSLRWAQDSERDDYSSKFINISADERWLLVENRDSLIGYLLSDGAERIAINGHRQAVRQLEFLSGSDLLLSSAEDNTVRLWNTSSGQMVYVISGGGERSGSQYPGRTSPLVTSSIDGQQIAWVTHDQRVHVTSFPWGKTVISGPATTSGEQGDEIRFIAFSTPGDRLYVIRDSGQVEQVSLPEGDTTIRTDIRVVTDQYEQIVASDEGLIALSLIEPNDSSSPRELSVTNLFTGLEIIRLTVAPQSNYQLAFALSADGRFLAESASENSQVRIWSLSDSSVKRQFESGKLRPHTGFSFSHDGQLLLARSGFYLDQPPLWRLWKWGKEAPCAELPATVGGPMPAISPDNRTLTYGADKQIIIRGISTCADPEE